MHYNLAFIGFGNVARALARLLERKRDLLKSKYDITYSVTGIATGSHGFAVNPNGLDVQQALEKVESRKSISPLSTFHVEELTSGYQTLQRQCHVRKLPRQHPDGTARHGPHPHGARVGHARHHCQQGTGCAWLPRVDQAR
ncbi:MAG: hypothetical protein QM730_12085 [Anaerolineales bacterium]